MTIHFCDFWLGTDGKAEFGKLHVLPDQPDNEQEQQAQRSDDDEDQVVSQ